MKKSKLLIPAVGFLMISLAAAGTSTVAWFTSTTAATATLGNIVGAKVDGGLKIYATNDTKINHDSDADTADIPAYAIADSTIITKADATTTLAFAIQEKGYLRDSSLKLTAAAGVATVVDYIPKDYNGTTGVPTSFENATTTANSSFYMKTGADTTEKDIYTYAKFTINYVSEAAENQAVYFNFKDSKIGKGNTFSTTTGGIEQAIRVGFVSADSGAPSYASPTIFAPANSKDILTTDGSGLSYVSGATTTDIGYYTKTQAVNANTLTETALATYLSYQSFATDVGTYHDSLSYLGTVKKDVTFAVTFYVWFDGLDPKCVDENNLTNDITEVFQGSFKFFSVKKAA